MLTILNRFTLAHLHGQCRRSVNMEYFGENPKNCETSGQCCDIYGSSLIMVNRVPEMKAVAQAVKELPNSAEKKVRHIHISIMYNLDLLYVIDCPVDLWIRR